MKKIYTLAIVIFATAINLMAQAPIPMPVYSFDTPFPTSMPVGWSSSLNLGNTTDAPYLTNFTHSAPQAARINSQNEFVQINCAGQMGQVKYWFRGTPQTGGTTFGGTFKVEESPDGATWTTLHSFIDSQVNPSNYDSILDTPLASSRYIRWILTVKVGGSNIGLDDIQIAAPVLNLPEINATFLSNPVYTNGYVVTGVSVGNSVNLNIHIQNQGVAGGNLTLGTPTITGTAATEYTLVSSPLAVVQSSDSIIVISFTPTVNGTRPAVLTIPNNDSDENPYIINLNCTGGLLVSEPTAQPSNLVLSNVKTYRINGNFTPTTIDNFGGYLIIKSKTPIPTTVYPTDGKVYQRGDTVQGIKVIYSGASSNFVASEVYANTTYYFAVWAYNGAGTTRNYLQANPITANATTPATGMQPNYYSSINTSSTSFISDLTTKCNVVGRNKIYYGNYGSTMMKLFAATDTFAGQKVATCVYSGEKYLYSGTIAWGYMSREHSYCHNWMPTDPADGTGGAPLNYEHAEYNDQHHLFPTNQNDVNAVRSNNPMGHVVTVQSTYLGSKVGLDSLGHKVFEPRDSQKGKTARAIMYMAVAYNFELDSAHHTYNWKFRNPISATIPYAQDQSILKRWNAMYPPDNYEISRNDFIDSLQHNRNPFVDHPEYACFIDFRTMSFISNPTTPCYFDTVAASLCATPTQITVDSITTTSAHLSWNPVSAAISYTINYKKVGGAWQIATSNIPSYTFTNLDASSQYNFNLKTICQTESSLASAPNGLFSTADVGFIELTSASVLITPNPSNGNFKVIANIKTGTTLNVSIIDIAGRTCFTENKNISSSSFDVNTNGLKAGVYTLRLSNKNGVANHKIVIE